MSLVGGLLAAAAAAPGFAAERNCTHNQPTPSAPAVSYDVFMVFFDWDSSAITPQTAAILDNAARWYAPLSQCVVLIATHSDRSGAAAYNLILSERRAEAIGAYLRRRGVSAAVRIEPYGETRPLVETADGVHEPQNRRAEIIVVPPSPR